MNAKLLLITLVTGALAADASSAGKEYIRIIDPAKAQHRCANPELTAGRVFKVDENMPGVCVRILGGIHLFEYDQGKMWEFHTPGQGAAGGGIVTSTDGTVAPEGLEAGARVKVNHGASPHNGRLGTAKKWLAERGRWKVVLDGGGKFAISPANLELEAALDCCDGSGAAATMLLKVQDLSLDSNCDVITFELDADATVGDVKQKLMEGHYKGQKPEHVNLFVTTHIFGEEVQAQLDDAGDKLFSLPGHGFQSGSTIDLIVAPSTAASGRPILEMYPTFRAHAASKLQQRQAARAAEDRESDAMSAGSRARNPLGRLMPKILKFEAELEALPASTKLADYVDKIWALRGVVLKNKKAEAYAKRFGAEIHENFGGMSAMLSVHEQIQDKVRARGDHSLRAFPRELEYAWDGVGDWRG